ncbi:hypothetical protein [Staphylococcus phage S24-1]|uniref:Uncharacterized protein n=1 Tax=Staphylococcus phage S24-1 TaxID=1010614 RepID=G9M934_BPPS4|nr:hypothetical protein StPhS24-1_gp01 [Staphylococcus phage S24-1]BAL42288.1 hypothetical protein [Staphylococcus phage S24-1]
MENVKPLQSFFLQNGDIAILMGDESTYEVSLFVIEKSSFEQLEHNSPKKIIDDLWSDNNG